MCNQTSLLHCSIKTYRIIQTKQKNYDLREKQKLLSAIAVNSFLHSLKYKIGQRLLTCRIIVMLYNAYHQGFRLTFFPWLVARPSKGWSGVALSLDYDSVACFIREKCCYRKENKGEWTVNCRCRNRNRNRIAKFSACP